MSKLIQIAVALAIAAAASGNLPRILVQVKLAQLQLLKDSLASRWGEPFLLPITKERKGQDSDARVSKKDVDFD